MSYHKNDILNYLVFFFNILNILLFLPVVDVDEKSRFVWDSFKLSWKKKDGSTIARRTKGLLC